MKKNYILTSLLIILISGFSFGQEMLLNGGLENWDSDTAPTDWTKAEVLTKSTDAHSGSFSAVRDGGSGTKDLSQTITGIIPGESYTLTAWYKVTAGDEKDARVWSTWKNGSTTVYHAGTSSNANDDPLRGPNNGYFDNNGGVWSKYELTVTAPSGVDSFYFEVRSYSNSTTHWDDLSFVKNSSTSTTVNLQDFTNLTNTATADVYGGFGGGLTATNAVVDDPTDASNKVRTVTTTAGGDVWKGVFLRPQTHYIDLTSTKTVSVKVYSTTATYFKGIIQAGQSGQPTIELATSEAHTGSGWETLTFTFPTATGEWGELALRTNVDASGALIDPAVEVLEAHFDDLTADQGSEIPAPASGPTDSPTAPNAAAADVVSVFSDAYTNIATNYNPGWGQSGSVNISFDSGDGNNVMLYSNFNFQGTDLTSTDLTAMEKLHIDIWVEDASVRTIKVSPIGGGETLVTVPVTSGAWNSVDIPLSSFTAVNFAAVGQLKFDGQFAADGTTADTAVRSDVYLDNIYFYKESTASTTDNELLKISMYPNPASSRLTISAPKTINSAAIYNILGKQVMSLEINKNSESIDVSNLATGMYLIKYSIDNAVGTAKFIKQ